MTNKRQYKLKFMYWQEMDGHYVQKLTSEFKLSGWMNVTVSFPQQAVSVFYITECIFYGTDHFVDTM